MSVNGHGNCDGDVHRQLVHRAVSGKIEGMDPPPGTHRGNRRKDEPVQKPNGECEDGAPKPHGETIRKQQNSEQRRAQSGEEGPVLLVRVTGAHARHGTPK